MNNRILLHGDCLDKLVEIPDNSIDLICTDPPYGYGFMNKDWDKAIISTEVWKECLRVLKPGSFAFVMSAPRQDVLSHMIVNLSKAGFKTDFTSIYWAYASGFPKSMNISKAVDKKLKYEREITGQDQNFGCRNSEIYRLNTTGKNKTKFDKKDLPSSEQAKKLDGSYAGFQPKPAVEVILVCMKPLSEKNYIDQAMKDSKGVTWLDDCRVPYKNESDLDRATFGNNSGLIKKDKIDYGDFSKWKYQENLKANPQGRFPANLIVSDNSLDEESKYFSLDQWEAQFIITPKPSKSEKNKGLDNFLEPHKVNDGRKTEIDNPFQRGETIRQNTHPTVKPISLFKYLITMGSRPNDFVLDPFMGSGTTAIASELTSRNWIGIEMNDGYIEIIKRRVNHYKTNRLDEF